MCTVHLCSAQPRTKNTTAQALAHALSYFSAPNPETDLLFWWDGPTQKQHSGHCLSTWCHEHSELLGQELATLMQGLARQKVAEKEVQHWLQIDETLSHWYTSLLFEKHPQILPHLFAACKLYAFSLLLEEHAPQCHTIVVHVDDSRVQEALRLYCKQKGLRLISASPKTAKLLFKHRSTKELFSFLPHGLQKLLRLGHWLWLWRKLWKPWGLGVKRHAKLSTSATAQYASIVGYFPHMHEGLAQKSCFRSHYWEGLHTLLEPHIQNQKLHIHWLFIRITSPQASLQKSFAFKEAFQKHAENSGRSESFSYAEEFLCYKSILQAYTQSKRIQKHAVHIQKELESQWKLGESALSLWPFFREAWQESFYGWRGLERCLQQQALQIYAQSLSQELPSQAEHIWTLFPWENCPWERRLIEAMRTYFPQSTVYAAQHSSLRKSDFRYFDGQEFFRHAQENTALERALPHYYCLNGEHALKNIQACIPQEKIRLVEALRYAYMESMPHLASSAPLQRIVLITSYFPKEVEAHIRTLAQCWQEEHFRKSYAGKIYIKAHPHCSVQKYMRRYKIPFGAVVFITSSLQRLWQDVQHWQEQGENALLWLSNSTTVTLEAAHMGLPLCVQGPEDNFSLCPLHGMKELHYVYDYDDVLHALAQSPKISLGRQSFFLQNTLPRWQEILHVKDIKSSYLLHGCYFSCAVSTAFLGIA